MKTASVIWDEFSNGKISAKQAFEDIHKSLQHCSEKETGKLLKLSEKILDKEVPMVERNSEVEQVFWNATHRESEE